MRTGVYRQRLRARDEPHKPDAQGGTGGRGDDWPLFSEGGRLSRFFGAVRAQSPLLLAIVLIATLIAAVLVFLQAPVYTASTRVQLDPISSDAATGALVVRAVRETDDMALETEVEAIRSRPIIESVIDWLNLDRDPEFSAAAVAADDSDAEGPPERGALIAAVRQAISVKRIGDTSVIEIRCDSRRPQTAQALCTTVAEMYLAGQLQRKVSVTERADEWLTERIDELRGELEERQAAIAAFRASNGLIGANAETLNQQQLTQLNTQLADARAVAAESRARLRQAEAMRAGSASNQAIAEVLGSAVVEDLRRQESALIGRRAELATRYRPTHPSMKQVERELAEVRRAVRREVDRLMIGLESEAALADERVSAIESGIAQQSTVMGEDARTVARLRELEQDAQATREIYRSFLARAKEIADQASIQTPDSRILSAAALPTSPSRPQRLLIIALVFMAATVVGTGAAVAVDFADRRIRSPEMAYRATGLQHLGSVPLVTDKQYQGRPHRDLLDRGTSVFSEAFEELYTRLQAQSAPRPPRTILFTSAAAAEGKTTSALCFALAAARAGKRVVLVEGDLRCPTIYDVVAIQGVKVEDLKAVLDGDLDWDEIAWTEPQTGLRILPVQAPSDDPVAHLSSARLEELLEDLRAEFDMVVIDTAPVLPVNDALKLMPFADKVVFVQRWQVTTRDEVQTAVRKIRDVGGDLAGSILTFVDGRMRWRFGDAGLPNPSGRNRNYYGRR